MAGYLLDTNVCIDFALGRSTTLYTRMRTAPGGTLSMSAVTFAELSVGARNSSDREGDMRRLNMLARLITVHPFDRGAAERYGRVARSVGVRRGSFDRLIGAHALALGLILVTNNVTDFADIPGLSVENWTLPL